MKQLFFKPVAAGIALSVMIAAVSCKKDNHKPTPPKTVRYIIFTDQDFHDDNHNITFELRIHQLNGRNVLDTFLAPMKISEIPDKAHALVFDKTVPAGHENETLQLGIIEEIEDIGIFGTFDTLGANEQHHTIERNFH